MVDGVEACGDESLVAVGVVLGMAPCTAAVLLLLDGTCLDASWPPVWNDEDEASVGNDTALAWLSMLSYNEGWG